MMDRRWDALPGPGLLRAFLARQKDDGWTSAKLAGQLGVTPSAVYFWSIGFRRPMSPDIRQALKRITKVRASAWSTKEELAEERRLRSL
jgi:transposase-like protein